MYNLPIWQASRKYQLLSLLLNYNYECIRSVYGEYIWLWIHSVNKNGGSEMVCSSHGLLLKLENLS